MAARIPYGGWPSPLGAAALAAGSSALGELHSAGLALYWLESRPTEQGRSTLMCRDASGALSELTPAPISVRSRVHEYGGGAFLPTTDGVFFVNDRDGELYFARPAGAPHRLTRLDGITRLADLAWDADRARIIAVCERHPAAAADAAAGIENLLVALPLDAARTRAGPLVELHRGHDFYAAPRIASDGRRLAFVAWDDPNMPWDGTVLKVADFAADGSLVRETVIAGSAAESVQQPLWMPDGALVFVSDQNGFWNLYRYDESGVHCLLEDGAEYAEAPWTLAERSFAAIGPGHLVACRSTPGQAELVLVDARTGFASPLTAEDHAEWQEYRSLCADHGTIAFIGARQAVPPAIATLRLDTGIGTIVRVAAAPALDASFVSGAIPRRSRARDGAVIHACLYLPRNPTCTPLPGTLPPLLVAVHGGPTARASQALNLRTQYFTTRGWAVLEVDYRGSTGYGRAYRSALNGRWGILDVTDCEDAVRSVIHDGLVDPARIAIRGSSAGGFTVLSALAQGNLFRAGVSLYGIGDLDALAAATHKFEARYLDTLLGSADTRAARSPIRHVGAIRAPCLLLQGSDDRVVPPAQARAMAAALRANGTAVALLEFTGEGHGFRQAPNIERAIESEYAFCCRVFGIAPSEPLPHLEIENL